MSNRNPNVISDSMPCNCCGMHPLTQFSRAKPENWQIKWGIRVTGGHYGVAGDTGKQEITHLDTRLGPLTIGVRYEW